MANKRDDFSESTKRKMAQRVGFCCSFPDCNVATFGPSYEGKDKVSNVGVAAHICAATPGGKRYDPNMTSDERKSIDNGIWLCQNHAWLIDTDENTYTVELLKEWKKQAEELASKRIADGRFLNNYFNVNGNDITSLTDFLDNCICDGEYKTISFVINNYKSNLGDTYNEIVLRYQIIYCAYCDRSILQENLDKYLSLPKKDGIDKLAELFISFDLVSYLSQIVDFINHDKLKAIAKFAVSDQLMSKLLFSSKEEKIQKVSFNGFADSVNKYLAFNVFKKNWFHLVDQNGNLYQLYNNEFLFICLSNSFEISRCISNNNNTPIEKDLDFFTQNIDKISNLDNELQILIFDTLLKHLSMYPKEFRKLYAILPDELKTYKNILESYYLFQIETKDNVNDDEILSFCSNNNDYHVALCYVVSLSPEQQLVFLNQHQFLYGKDAGFIALRYKASKEGIDPIIETYKDKYSDVFGFACIEVLEGNTDKLTWLIDNKNKLTLTDCSFYISVLEKNNLYEELISLAEIIKSHNLLNYELYRIAVILSQNSKTMPMALNIFFHLTDKGYQIKGFSLNKGILERSLGKIETAKECFAQEFDLYNSPDALVYLLNIRYENNQFYIDKYLEAAKAFKDNAALLGLLGATLAKLSDKNAYKYFLKSLLIDDSNDSIILNLLPLVNPISSNSHPEHVEENTVCMLSSDEEKIKVAIHEPSLLEGITPNNFSDCFHISFENQKISQLLYRKVGEKTRFLDKEYTVTEIEYLPNYLDKIAIQKMVESPESIIFSGDIKQSLKELTQIAKKNAEEIDEIVNHYNSTQPKLPIAWLSKSLGKSRLICLDFLHYQNKDKFQNNQTYLPNSVKNYVLSYDAIVTLCKLDICDKLLLNCNLCCTQQVNDQLISDINSEMESIKSPHYAGNLCYKNEKLVRIEYDEETKRNHHQFFSQLKAVLKSLSTIKNKDYDASDKTISQFLIKEKWLCESTSLASVKDNSDDCLVSDDQFIQYIAVADKSNCIGIISLISNLTIEIEEFINLLLSLKSLNYAYYFSPELYNKGVELIIASKDQKNAQIMFLNFLKTDIPGEKPSENHSRLISSVFLTIEQNDNGFLLENKPIMNIVLYHLMQLIPDYFTKTLNQFIDEGLGTESEKEKPEEITDENS